MLCKLIFKDYREIRIYKDPWKVRLCLQEYANDLCKTRMVYMYIVLRSGKGHTYNVCSSKGLGRSANFCFKIYKKSDVLGSLKVKAKSDGM